MINLLFLLCSLCIQLGVVGYGGVSPDYQYIVDEIQQKLSGGNGWQQDYSRTADEYWLVFLRDDGNYQVLIPREIPEPNYSSSDTVTSLIDDIGLNVTFYNYVFMTYNGTNVGFEWPASRSYSFYYYNAEDYFYPRLVYVGRDSFYYDGEYQVNLSVPEDITVPVFVANMGSLGVGGHSNGDPMESFTNFSWSAHSSTYTQSGHNTHVTPSSATPDFTNAEQNLLGQIVDNTNSIIENTNSLGGALETINGNIINGASAIFNAISQFNNNFISSYVYDQEKVDEALDNSSMMLFAQTSNDLTETIINESQVLLDAVHDMEEKQDLILYLDLTKWKVPVYSSSTGVNTSYIRPYNEVVEIDFSFLKETKSIWQPILLGVLYLALFMSIYFDLPNILRGANA